MHFIVLSQPWNRMLFQLYECLHQVSFSCPYTSRMSLAWNTMIQTWRISHTHSLNHPTALQGLFCPRTISTGNCNSTKAANGHYGRCHYFRPGGGRCKWENRVHSKCAPPPRNAWTTFLSPSKGLHWNFAPPQFPCTSFLPPPPICTPPAINNDTSLS